MSGKHVRSIVIGTLACLTACAIALPASAADFEGCISAYGIPIPHGVAGLMGEGRFPAAHMSLSAMGAASIDSYERFGSVFGTWTPLQSDRLSIGVMVGYGLSNSGDRFGMSSVNDVLIGPVWNWDGGSWWMRVNPYLGWRRYGVNAAAMFFGSIAGPSLLELGWRPMPHLELGLRASPTPLRIGYVW